MDQYSDEVVDCLIREQDERAMAESCTNPAAHDSHLMLAERYADRAWSLSEASDEPFIPSALWVHTVRNR